MGKNWAIAVGINVYDNLVPLKYAKADAEAMASWFKDEAKFNQVFLFTEDSPSIREANPPIPTQPTFARFQRFLDVQFERPLLKPQDNLWFFFAGHGRRYADQDYLMFLDSNPQSIEKTAISVEYVTQRLRRCGADNVVLFLDACRDEDSRGGSGIGQQEHKGVITFYSCSANQQSWEIEELQHGSFTHTLLQGLRLQGEANRATVERLNQYLCSQVPSLNYRYKKPDQNPYLKAEPPYKMYLILLEQSATLKDVEPLKLQASLAENRGNLSLAKQLWIRILAVSRADWDAIDAIERIAIRQQQASPPKEKTVISIPETNTPSQGERSGTSEIIAVPELDKKLQTFPFQVITVNDRGEKIKRESGQAQYFTEDLGNGVSLDMVFIPGGSFMMGTEESEIERLVKKYHWNGFRREKPQHEVTVKPFFIGKYLVTQAQWKAISSYPKVNHDLNPNASRFKGDDLPVENVSWYDAVEFCQRLSLHTGKEYRLPSEAEWEYACRAGTTTPFYFGETITGELANYSANTIYANEAKGEYRGKTITVGSFPPNSFGLCDMHGNVWEWCEDDWHDSYEGAPTDSDACISAITSIKVVRGGSWAGHPVFCRSACRNYDRAVFRDDDYGFRVACGVPGTL